MLRIEGMLTVHTVSSTFEGMEWSIGLFISTEQRSSLVVITTWLAFNTNTRSRVAAGWAEFMKMLAYFKASYRFSPGNLKISLNSVRCHECSVTLQMYATRVQLFEICSLCISQFYINALPQRLCDRCRPPISRHLRCRKPTDLFFRGLASQKSLWCDLDLFSKILSS